MAVDPLGIPAARVWVALGRSEKKTWPRPEKMGTVNAWHVVASANVCTFQAMDDTKDTSGPTEAGPSAPPPRLSMLAMASLALAVIALVGGCGSMALAMMVAPEAVVAVMAAPLLGIIATVMGFMALRRIERSGGVLLGRPAGLAGLFLGLIAATVMGFMVMASMIYLSGSRTLAPVAAELVAAAQQLKPAQAREILSQEASDDISASQLAAFGGATRRAGGKVTGDSAGISLIFESQQIAMQSQGSTSISVSNAPRPVWILLDDQPHFAYVFVNQEAVKEKKVRIDDMLIFTGVNEVIVLREFGPAQIFANDMGWTAFEQ